MPERIKEEILSAAPRTAQVVFTFASSTLKWNPPNHKMVISSHRTQQVLSLTMPHPAGDIKPRGPGLVIHAVFTGAPLTELELKSGPHPFIAGPGKVADGSL